MLYEAKNTVDNHVVAIQTERKRVRDTLLTRWMKSSKLKQTPQRKRTHSDPTTEPVLRKFLKVAQVSNIHDIIENDEGVQLRSMESNLENLGMSEMSGVEKWKGVG